MRQCWAATFVLGVVALHGCDTAEYTIVVRFEPPALAEDAERIDVALVESCAAQPEDGGEAVDPVESLVLRRGETGASVGDLGPGDYGLHARAWSGDCRVIAAGCDAVELEAGGEGELVVTVEAVSGPGCPPGATCEEGACVSEDGGTGDAGGGDAAMPDGGSDAGPVCMCAECAVCQPDGSCVPDHEACASDELCDPIAGCTEGTRCTDGGGCPDDGDPCSMERCDTERDPPLCLTDPAPDGTACAAAGVSGRCRAGSCCPGCWDGSACQTGDDPSACGAGGGRCADCDDRNPCTTDACAGGTCEHGIDDSASCPDGTCHGGACCTGCWDGAACEPGDTDGACGADGASCDACDPGGCPPTSCTPTGCMSLGATVVDARTDHTCAIASDGSLWCWGDNEFGELGLGDTMERSRPTPVGTDTWTAIATGQQHTCGIRSDGSLWCWGRNQQGQLGVGDTSDRSVPTRVGTRTNWASLDVSSVHSCAIRSGGTLWCWGDDSAGQLGIPGFGDRTSPEQVGTDSDWRQVSARTGHTCGVRTSGELWCWGSNREGELGLGAADAGSRRPARVGSASNWAQVSAAGSTALRSSFTCAVRTGGTLWCWGDDDAAQLGLGGPGPDRPSPQQVGSDTDWAWVHGGREHVVAIKTDGSLWSWGHPANGRLARSGARGTPGRVGSDADWIHAVAAFEYSCGVHMGGAVECWGENGEGQLGDDTTTDAGATPTRSCL